MAEMYTVWYENNYEPTRLRFNQENEIPPEGKNGFRKGVEVTDGTGKTYNRRLAVKHPTENKYYIKNIFLDQQAIDSGDEQLTHEQMIDQGFITIR